MAKKQIVQVGLGDFGRRWMNVVLGHPEWEYAALATRNEEVLNTCAELAGVPTKRRFRSLDELFDAGVTPDAVLITTPYFRHAGEVTLSLEHGCNVLVEKPLAGTLKEAIELVETTQTSEKTVMVAENYRFGAAARLMRDLVSSGSIGTAEMVDVAYFVRHDFAQNDWRIEYRYPVLIENSTHHFDLVRYITGQNADTVYCRAFGTARPSAWEKPNVMVQLTLKNGAEVSYRASWTYSEFETPWEGEWSIRGSKGSLRWTRGQIELIADGATQSFAVDSKDSDHTLGATFAEFNAALEEGRRPTVDIQDNLQTIGIVFAAIESSNSKQPLNVSDFISQPSAFLDR